jgi:hypothetical protein
LRDLCDKAVSQTGHSLDIGLTICILPECLAQNGDIGIDVVFFDHGIRPHLPEQRFFSHQAPGVLYQHTKRFERLKAQGH